MQAKDRAPPSGMPDNRMTNNDDRTLHPVAVGGLLAGMGLMFATGLLVSV